MTVAIDGKVLRGAWTDENDRFTLFSAMIHRLGVTVAHVHVRSTLRAKGSRDIEHTGSAHDDALLELLKAAARQRLAAGQGEFDLKLNSLRVLEEVGIRPPSYPTVNRRLPVLAKEWWRERLAVLCAHNAFEGNKAKTLNSPRAHRGDLMG